MKKEDVKQRIDQAALELFSQRGLKGTSIQMIAKKAQLSVGNIYRYYPNKKTLLTSLLPPSLTEEVLILVEEKIRRWFEGGSKSRPFLQASHGLAQLLVSQRQAILILFKKDDHFSEQLAQKLRNILQSIQPPPNINDARLIDLFYRQLVETIHRLIQEISDEHQLNQGMNAVLQYHLRGITSFYEKENL